MKKDSIGLSIGYSAEVIKQLTQVQQDINTTNELLALLVLIIVVCGGVYLFYAFIRNLMAK